MIENIAVIIIVGAALIYLSRKLYMFFKNPSQSGCSPEKCSSCPFNTMEGCEPENPRKKQPPQ